MITATYLQTLDLDTNKWYICKSDDDLSVWHCTHTLNCWKNICGQWLLSVS